MLVLAREKDQEIVLGEKAEYRITVVRIEERHGELYADFILTCPEPTAITICKVTKSRKCKPRITKPLRLHRLNMWRGSKIRFCDVVEIEVVDIRPNQKVRFGCTVPESLPAYRLEVWEALERQRKSEYRPQ